MQQKSSTQTGTPLHEPLSYWQKTALHLAFSSQLPTRADVVVIGSGLLGAATCYWVARTGSSVVLLDRAMPAAGATGRNGGFIAVGPDEVYAQAIARLGHEMARAILEVTLESQTLLRHVLEDEKIVCDYREPGLLHLALEEEKMHLFAQSRRALQQEGIPTFLLDREQIRDSIHTPLGPQILGALFVPNMGFVHSVKLVQGLVTAAQRYGAQSVMTTVLHLHPDGESIHIQTTQGNIHAGSVVVAVNAWIPDLFPHLSQVITPVRGQVLAYQPHAPIFRTGVTVDLAGSEAYWQQTPDGTILLGGCRSAAEGHDIGIRVSQPTAAVQHALEQVFPHLFPHLPVLPVAQRWAGLMAFTPDFLPVADQVQHLPNTWIVGGFSGHGMPYGLRFGQLVAKAATEKRTPPDLFPFRLNRATLT